MSSQVNSCRKKNLEEFKNTPVLRAFMVHRRVFTNIWHKYKLNGYEIEFLLLVIMLCKYEENVEVTGGVIRKHLNRRFQVVWEAIINKLVNRRYLIDNKNDKHHGWHRIMIGTEGLEFYEYFKQALIKHLDHDMDMLCMPFAFKNEVKRVASPPRGGKKKNNKS